MINFNRSAFASRFCKYCGEAYRARIWSSSNSESGGGVVMLSAESQVEAMLGWWKIRGLTRKSSCSARSWYSERCLSSVNSLWSLLGSWPVRDGSSANEQTLNLTKIGARLKLTEKRIRGKWGRSCQGRSARARCGCNAQVRCEVWHCAVRCGVFLGKTQRCAPILSR